MRKFVFFVVFLGLFCHYHVNAQDITVANSTDQALYFPVSPYHWNSSQHSQSIYPASMLTELQGKYITALTWYMTTPSVNWPDTQIVRLGITNSTNLSNGLINTTTLTEVWSGRLSIFAGNNMLRIPLDIPFQYNGGNLIVEIVKEPLDDGYGNFSFYGQNQSGIMSLNQVGTYYAPYEGYFLPKLTFTCQNELCSYPEYLQVSDITHNSTTLSWTPGILGDANEYIVAYRSASDNEYTEVTTTDTFLTVTDLQSITTYYWKVKVQCIDTFFSGWSMENTFTTQRFLATIPYFCDFEDSVENANWNTPVNASIPPYRHDKWHIGTYVSYSGAQSMYVSYNDGATNLTGTSNIDDGFDVYDQVWAYREFNIDTLYPQYNISFRHRGYEHYTAFFGPPDNSPFSSILTIVNTPAGAIRLSASQTLPQDSVWMEHSYTFSVDTPGIYRLYFSWYTVNNNGRPGASIDDISITGVYCLPPNTLTSTNITDSSATLSWHHDCVNTPMGYVVGYKTAGDYNYTEITVYDTNTLTITGLMHHTTYYWRVKALYNDSFSSDWSSEANFQTDLIWVHPLPYTCDFEDAAEILAWNVPVVSGNNKNRWYIGHNTYSSVNTSLYVSTNTNGNNNSYNNQATSKIWTYRDIYFNPQYSGYELSFDAKVNGHPDYAFAQVFVGAPVAPTDSTAAENMVLIDDRIDPTGSVWKHFDYALDSTFAGHRRLFFAWQTYSTSSIYSPAIAIDDISISGTHCAHPLQRTSVVADTTVRLSWQNITVGMPESYTVAYKAAADTIYTLLVTSDTLLTITGLQPLTNYTWKVRSNCSDGEHSDWSTEESFKTFQLLATMPYVCGFEDSLDNALWNSYYQASTHQWCVGNAVQNNGQYSCYISHDNGVTYDIINPSHGKAYLYRDFIFDPTYDEYVLEFNFKTFDTTSQTDLSVYVESPNLPDFIIPSIENQVKTLRYTDTLWHPVSITLNRTHSGIQRLVFEWTKEVHAVAKGSCAVDDITLTAAICGRPYALEVSDITQQSALLSWVSGNRHTPTSYTVAYRAYPDTLFTTLTLTDTFCPLNQLSLSTPYIWKVRANSSAGNISEWSEENLFSTAAVTPYFTGFEDTVENHCWHDFSNPEGDNFWVIGGAVHCDSLHSLYVSNNNGLTNTASNGSTVVYKDIYFGSGADGYHLSFDHYGKEISVYVGNIGADISTASLVGNVPNSAYWRHHHIVLDTTFIGLKRVFLVGLSTGVIDNAGAVDNFMAEAVSCPAPVGLASAYTDANAFQLSWSPVNGTSPQGYQIAYKQRQDHDYVIVNTTDTFVMLSGLAYKAYYYWKVRSLCSNGNDGEWGTDEEFLTRQPLPYYCDFEDPEENTNWTYDVPSGWNYWAIGAAPIDNGNVTLHLGSGLGDGNYNYYATARLWAYRDIYIGGGNSHYLLSFDFRGLGQPDVDFARVYLGPPATPSGLDVPNGAEQIGGNFGMVPLWSHYSFEIDSSHTGLQRLYFQWRCDGSSGMNPGAAFDNITIQVYDCTLPVTPKTMALTATTATLSWSSGNPNALPLNYTVAYRLLNDTVYTELTSNDTILQITGLQPDSYYYWKVRANCSSADSSLWSESRVFATTQSSPATTPYVCGFEDASENAAWSNRHITGPSKWVVGSAVYLDGDSALYVSDNDGATCSYTNGQNSTDWVYRDIYFQPGNNEYEISFDFKGTGTNYHYAVVYLGEPEVIFESFTPEGAKLLGGSLYNIPNWQHYSFILDSTYAGLHRLYILWQNNTYTATQPPAAIDNLMIQATYCRKPIDLISEASAHSATLSWTLRYGGSGEDYTVAYRPQNDTSYTYVNVSDTILILQNLNSDVYYSWKVRHNCDTSCSLWSEEKTFYTNDNILICDFDIPGSTMGWEMQSSTPDMGWYVGRHNDCTPEGMLYVSADSGQTNSYVQTIAADLWAYTDVSFPQTGSVYYLSFDFKGMGENNYDYMNVYMGPPTLPSGSATPQGAAVLAQKICQKAGWTHYSLALNPTYTGSQRIYFHWHNDNSYGTNPPAAIDNVIISKNPLLSAEFVQVTPYDTVASLIWSFGNSSQASSYTLSYGALYIDSLMTEINLPDTTCLLGNLLPNTDYLCKVRANYADGSFSLWHMTTFHTQITFAQTPYYCGFEDLTENECWQFVNNGSVNQWVIDTAARNGGERAMYISNDGGATNAYTINTITRAWAYRNIYLDPAQSPYQLYFDFRGEGELYNNAVYDYAKVFIGPSIVPAASSSTSAIPSELTQLDETLYYQSEWATHCVTIDSTHTGFLRLFLYWNNDGSYGTNPAAAFDNIYIVPFGCTSPTAITVDSISYTEVSFHLTDYSPINHDWDVAIVAENDTLDETLAQPLHDNLWHTFTELDSGTVYTLYARTHCSDTTFSDWISLTVITLADTIPVDTTHHDDTVSIDRYQLEQAISLYPNPSEQYVNVYCKNGVIISQIEVYDTYGRLLIRSEAIENPKRLNVSELAAGMYLMRIITDGGVVTKPFIRR